MQRKRLLPGDRTIMLKTYIQKFIEFSGYRAAISMILFFFLGLTQGIGLLMIVPLMSTIGINSAGETSATSGISHFIEGIFAALGLPLNVLTVLGAYVIIVSVFAVLKRCQAVLDVSLQQGFILYLRNRLYSALTYARWLFIVGRKSSDITHCLTSDIQRVGSGTRYFLMFFNESMLVIFQLGAAVLLSPIFTAATLAFGLFIMILLRPLNRSALDSGQSYRQWRKALFGTVMEHLNGMKTAKSLGLEQAHLEKMEQVNSGIRTQMTRIAAIRANTRMVYEIAAVTAVALYLGATLNIPSLKLPLTHVLVLVFIFSRMLPRFSSILQSLQQIKHMLPAFRAVTELYEEAAAAREYGDGIESERFTIEENIRFENVRFRYSPDSKEDALKGVNFEIPAHQITALAGPSGAGKSTVADLLLGLLTPDEGRIIVDGRTIKENDLPAWRHSIGYVPQDLFLFHDSLRANLLWACPTATEEELWTALEMAAAEDFVKHLPQELDTIAGDRGITLSGGERQRIALARALLRKPKLLVLDEATSALDLENEQRIHAAIKELAERLTVVIIAHRPSTLDIATHIINLHRGNIV